MPKWSDYQLKEKKFWTQFGNKRFSFLAHYDFLRLVYLCYCKFLHDRIFRRALEIGVGACGGFLTVIPGIKSRHGVDSLVDELREEDLLPFEYHINYTNARAEKLPYEDEIFDLVIIANTLDHCENMDKVVDEIKRVMTPRGYLLFMTFLGVPDPHPYTFNTPEEVKVMINMRVVEEHFVDESNKFRGRSPYYVAVFRK